MPAYLQNTPKDHEIYARKKAAADQATVRAEAATSDKALARTHLSAARQHSDAAYKAAWMDDKKSVAYHDAKAKDHQLAGEIAQAKVEKDAHQAKGPSPAPKEPLTGQAALEAQEAKSLRRYAGSGEFAAGRHKEKLAELRAVAKPAHGPLQQGAHGGQYYIGPGGVKIYVTSNPGMNFGIKNTPSPEQPPPRQATPFVIHETHDDRMASLDAAADRIMGPKSR
jgi:hypothetical protein